MHSKVTGDGVPRDGVPRDGFPEDGVPRSHEVPKDGALKNGAPKIGAPGDGSGADVGEASGQVDGVVPKVSSRRLVSLSSADFFGMKGRPVTVQVEVSGLKAPSFNVVGLPGKSTRESRDRIHAAIVNSGFRFPKTRILVNLAPASREKRGGGFDLPVALAILLASRQVQLSEAMRERLETCGFFGELGLHGELRPVRGAVLLSDGLRDQGVRSLVVPEENAVELLPIRDLRIFSARHLLEAVDVLRGRASPLDITRVRASGCESEAGTTYGDFAEVRGQEASKRACLIAAAGQHNILLEGPPGVGKTMLARRIPGIMPDLEFEEALEVLRIRSALGIEGGGGLPKRRAFRSPHHTISYAGLVGGGSNPMPGEVSRAHHGVLFLDEFPEFSRTALEALREPLEVDEITVSRSQGAVCFPARFLLVAAMNPCPCGYSGDGGRTCRCTPRQIQSYTQRISGPLADRIDIYSRVANVPPADLLRSAPPSRGRETANLLDAVLRARAMQDRRWSRGVTNSRAGLKSLLSEHCSSREALNYLGSVATKLELSARGFARTLRVARTIADLDGRAVVGRAEVLEALQWRRAVHR